MGDEFWFSGYEAGRRRAIGVVAALQPALGWRARQAVVAKRGRL